MSRVWQRTGYRATEGFALLTFMYFQALALRLMGKQDFVFSHSTYSPC